MSGEMYPSGDDSLFNFLDEQDNNVFSAGAKRAKKCEATLNEQATAEPLDIDFIRKTLNDLNAECGHYEMLCQVTSIAQKGIWLNNDYKNPEIDYEQKLLDDETMMSHGYVVSGNGDDEPYRIHHLACGDIKQFVIPQIEVRQRQHYYLLPIDGSASIAPKFSNERDTEMIEYYTKDIADQIKEATAAAQRDTPKEEFLSQALRNLGTIDLSQIALLQAGATDENLQRALSRYINTHVPIDDSALHTLLYDGDVHVVDGGGTYQHSVTLSKEYAIHGISRGVFVLRISEEAPCKLFLEMSIPSEASADWQNIYVPLTDSLWFYTCNRLPLAPAMNTNET